MKVPSKAAAVIRRVLPELASASLAKRQRGVDALADLIDLARVPQVQASTVPTVQPRPARPVAVACPPVGQQPPKRKRIVDPAAITAFKKAHPYCAVAGPDCDGPLDFSHIKARSAGGDDRDDNGISQCRYHHDRWHRNRVEWWQGYGARLNNEDRGKVLAVYPLLVDPDAEEVARG